MSTIKVRPLPISTVAVLEPRIDKFYVHRDGRMIPATLERPITKQDRELLSTPGGLPEGRFMPKVGIVTHYGVMFGVGADKIYAEDAEGVEYPLMRTVGAQVSLTVYAPGRDGHTTEQRVLEALRKEFGGELLYLRHSGHQPVSEAGLPPCLGALNGETPTLL